jgi:sarcosine oxidase delta subunit
MKIMPCPLNGPRNISEFSYGGELRQMPAPTRAATPNGPPTYSTATTAPAW